MLDGRIHGPTGIALSPWLTYYIYGFRYQKEYFNDTPKQKFLRALRSEKIPFTTMYFDELNKQLFLEHTLNSPTFQKIFSKERLRQYHEENCYPANNRLSAEGVRLPPYVFLGDKKDMDDIADAVAKIHDRKDQLGKI